ncbi:MAG: hypothetical protein Q7J59_06775 [Elusimicrobiota bacterium]|nr:hypothetical protein [Elusimicrobiota bacterium]
MISKIEINKSIIIKNHKTANNFVNSFPSLDSLSIDEVVERIINLNKGINKFWKSAKGWAPIEAAELLTKSRLDWQVSLSYCLKKWIKEPEIEMSDGSLILSWANLGSLVEGTMKLFLSVYCKDYNKDVEVIKRKEKIQSPDILMLEKLRQFFKKRIWDDGWDSWTQNIQNRRNAIHSFKSRNIGTKAEFEKEVRQYLKMLRYINYRLPYPDEIYEPQEI